jgi:hypothetical protein
MFLKKNYKNKRKTQKGVILIRRQWSMLSPSLPLGIMMRIEVENLGNGL